MCLFEVFILIDSERALGLGFGQFRLSKVRLYFLVE